MLTTNSATLVTSNISRYSTRSNTKAPTFTDTIDSIINMAFKLWPVPNMEQKFTHAIKIKVIQFESAWCQYAENKTFFMIFDWDDIGHVKGLRQFKKIFFKITFYPGKTVIKFWKYMIFLKFIYKNQYLKTFHWSSRSKINIEKQTFWI